MPLGDEQELLPLEGDPADPVALRAALAAEAPGVAPVLRAAGLLVLPSDALSPRVLLARSPAMSRTP